MDLRAHLGSRAKAERLLGRVLQMGALFSDVWGITANTIVQFVGDIPTTSVMVHRYGYAPRWSVPAVDEVDLDKYAVFPEHGTVRAGYSKKLDTLVVVYPDLERLS